MCIQCVFKRTRNSICWLAVCWTCTLYVAQELCSWTSISKWSQGHDLGILNDSRKHFIIDSLTWTSERSWKAVWNAECTENLLYCQAAATWCENPEGGTWFRSVELQCETMYPLAVVQAERSLPHKWCRTLHPGIWRTCEGWWHLDQTYCSWILGMSPAHVMWFTFTTRLRATDPWWCSVEKRRRRRRLHQDARVGLTQDWLTQDWLTQDWLTQDWLTQDWPRTETQDKHWPADHVTREANVTFCSGWRWEHHGRRFSHGDDVEK